MGAGDDTMFNAIDHRTILDRRLSMRNGQNRQIGTK